mgnify:CR=1 FL=1
MARNNRVLLEKYTSIIESDKKTVEEYRLASSQLSSELKHGKKISKILEGHSDNSIKTHVDRLKQARENNEQTRHARE